MFGIFTTDFGAIDLVVIVGIAGKAIIVGLIDAVDVIVIIELVIELIGNTVGTIAVVKDL